MKNFWLDLPKPFLVLAPMDDVTDTVFRQIVAKTARPDVFFTEFTNVEGLNSPGREAMLKRLKFTETERPIVAQIWGLQPNNFYKSAQLINKLGFDGIDINMGCPDHTVTKNGCCSAQIENPKLAKEIIRAVQKGSGDLPVSVKTRLGFKDLKTEEWIGYLLDLGLEALTIHGRIAREMSKYPANWKEIGKVVKLRNQKGVKTLIIGNGDVKNYQEAMEKCQEYGVDGIMIGRGIFHDPWAFNHSQEDHHSKEERLKLLLGHTQLFVSTWGKTENFSILKKFFKIYVNGFEGASDLRTELMGTNSLEEVEKILAEQLKM